MIRQEQRMYINELAECMNISHGLFHTMIHNYLSYRLLCAQWMLKILNDSQKTERFGTALMYLIHVHNEGDDFMSTIVTGGESWRQNCKSETRRQSLVETFLFTTPKESKRLSFPPERCCWPFFSFWIVMAHYWSNWLILERLSIVSNIVKHSIGCVLQSRTNKLENRWMGSFCYMTMSVLMLLVWFRKNWFKWETLQHPAYSPDLTPCDFHIYGN